MKNIFFSTLILLLAASCQTDAPKNAGQTLECYIRYLQPEGQIHAEASLKAAGKDTTLAVPNGGIRYQGGNMSEIGNGLFVVERSDSFRVDHTFSWEDAQQKRRQFKWELQSMTNGAFNKPELDMDSVAVYTWKGRPLQRGEAVVFMWQHLQTHQTIPMEIIATGADRIEFPGKKISELQTPGLWTLYTVRKRLQKDTVDGIPGRCILEYFGSEDTVKVIR